MGILTINSDASCCFREVIGYDAGNSTNACLDANGSPGTTVYIPFGFTFANCIAMWENIDGTGIPVKGWYSDGTVWRYWNEGFGFGTQATCAGESVDEIAGINFSPFPSEACAGTGSSVVTSVYVPTGETLATATFLFADATGSSPASTGGYSDGVTLQDWSSALGIESTTAC